MESDHEREARAAKLSYEKGRHDAAIDSRLESHESRLNAINGNIERSNRNDEKLKERFDALSDKFDKLVAQLETRDAVDQERNKQLRVANEKQISAKQFWLGVAMLIATLVVGFHGLHV